MALQVSVSIFLCWTENRNSNFRHTPLVASCSKKLSKEPLFPTLGKLDQCSHVYPNVFLLQQVQIQVQPKVQVKVPAGGMVMQYYMLSDQFADMRLARQTVY